MLRGDEPRSVFRLGARQCGRAFSCNLDLRIREEESETRAARRVGARRARVGFRVVRARFGDGAPPRRIHSRIHSPRARSYHHNVRITTTRLRGRERARTRALRALVRAVSALRRQTRRARRARARRRVSPQPPQVLPSVVEGVSSPLQFPTQHLQPSLGREIEHRRRFRSRARAGRVDAPRRASVVGLTAGREKHRPRDVCFPTDARWREDVGVPRRERALQPTHRLLEVATHGVHELAAHDVASPRRLDAHRAESPLHRGAHAETPRRTVWGWNLNAFCARRGICSEDLEKWSLECGVDQ